MVHQTDAVIPNGTAAGEGLKVMGYGPLYIKLKTNKNKIIITVPITLIT